MLYGLHGNWNKILTHAQQIAESQKMKLVYGATMGSISRGIPTIDSDYDIRFLYIREEFPETTYYPQNCKEEDIVYRYFSDKEHNTVIDMQYTYDRIAFWELSSFLRLFAEPQIGQETWDKNGLYYIVEHTFLSPYTWDPYGIQQKIIPFIHRYFKKEYSYFYYKKLLEKADRKEEMHIKDYMDALWAALSILWIERYEMPAPIDFWTLAICVEKEEEKTFIREWMKNKINQCNAFSNKLGKNERAIAREMAICKREKWLDKYMEKAYMTIEKNRNREGGILQQEEQKWIDDLLYIVDKSIHSPKVEGIN